MCLKQLKVLLADDDLDDCAFFEQILQELPQSPLLTIVNNGEQLMQLLANDAYKLPDVLFLDINMPRKNGFECLLEIKLNKKLQHLPVIMYSTSLEQEVVSLLYKNGAQYFIRKPSEFSQFKKIVQQTIELISQKNTSHPAREHFVITVQDNHADLKIVEI